MSDSMPPPPPAMPGSGNPYGQPASDYSQTGYQQPGYPPAGQPQWGAGPYGAAQIDHPKGTTVLVLGILGLAVCGVCGIVALVMSKSVLREIDANPGYYKNRGTVNAGRICGIISCCLMALGLLFFIAVFAIAAGSSTR